MSKKYLSFVKHATIEPAFFLLVTVYIIIDMTNKNIVLQKKCRGNITSEPDLNIRCIDEKPGILLVSQMNTYYRVICISFCSIVSIFVVCWSDEAGRKRKPLIVIPLIGLVFQCVAGCLHSYFWTWIPQAVVLTQFAIEMSSGGHELFLITAQIYICDISSSKSRTMRLGIISSARILGHVFGIGSCGYILRSVGFLYTYFVCLILSVVALILGLCLVKDHSVHVDKKPTLRHVFNVKRIIDSFKLVYKKNQADKRILISMLFFIYTAVEFSSRGEKSTLYIFLRHRFYWDERQYSSYSAYKYISAVVGGLFCSFVLSKRYQIHDGIIGIFASVWDTLTVLVYLFANQNWHIYVAPLFDVFHNTAVTVSYSFMSKYYEKDELGRLNSVLGIFTLIIPTTYSAYNVIFQKTLDFFPSAFFLLSLSLDVIVVYLYSISYILGKRIDKQEALLKEANLLISS